MEKRIAILGAGESGCGAAVLANKLGFDTFVSDFGSIADNYKKMLDEHNIEWEEKQHTEEKILNAQEIIKSPGIPNEAPIVKKAREAGITVPIVAGIMPVTNAKQIKRICSLSGTYLPQRFVSIVDKFGNSPEAMAQAGIAYATEQIIDLIANGVGHVHVYTMNRPEIAEKIIDNLSEIFHPKA